LIGFTPAAKLDIETTSQCVQRSIQDVASATLLVARSPVYVGDPVDLLVLTRTFWIGLNYHVTFDDNQSQRINPLTAVDNGSFPVWVIGEEFVSSAQFDNGGQLASAEGLVWVAMTHRYTLAGLHMVRLVVSGQLTMHGPIQRAEFAVNVLVRDWPSLRDVIGNVTFVSQSQPTYVNESVKFLYAVENVVPNINFRVHFGSDLESTVRTGMPTACIYSIIANYLDNIVILTTLFDNSVNQAISQA